MGLLKTIIICMLGYASAGMYVLGGLGQLFSDEVTFTTDTATNNRCQ